MISKFQLSPDLQNNTYRLFETFIFVISLEGGLTLHRLCLVRVGGVRPQATSQAVAVVENGERGHRPS